MYAHLFMGEGEAVTKIRAMVAILALVVGVQAAEIVVSWETNGMLVAEGLEPGSTGVVEWASSLKDGFTNHPAPFEGVVADSNGMVRVAIPRFFRVLGTPPTPPPQGMVLVPAGTNSGTNPLGVGESYNSVYSESYSLTVDAFFMDEMEVSRAQWDTVYDWAVTNGYDFVAGSGKGPDQPVRSVNWYNCVKWCNARSEMNGKIPCYTVGGSTYKSGEISPDCDLDAGGYRLPTSDEWEYAARGGLNNMRFPWGNTVSHANANYRANGSAHSYDTSPYTTYTFHPDYYDGSLPCTSPCGEFAANSYGLYDMSGNVLEWCNDWHPDYVGTYRLIRGGSGGDAAHSLRCGVMSRRDPYEASSYYGLRAVLPVN